LKSGSPANHSVIAYSKIKKKIGKVNENKILSLEGHKNKKPGFITSIKTGRGITGTRAQRY
jgi:hypothetical protein